MTVIIILMIGIQPSIFVWGERMNFVKEAIMEHYNDNLAGEDEISRFCAENKCSRCDTCEHSYYVYGSEQNCSTKYASVCLSDNYSAYEQTKPLRKQGKVWLLIKIVFYYKGMIKNVFLLALIVLTIVVFVYNWFDNTNIYVGF